MRDPRHFILATAGHVDHGKSALVRALTGTDPDRLPEEKARGITIDLGFAHLELGSRDGERPPLLVGIVDVPGHEDFVKNMVAGVGSIDLALLVVAVDDGWMPQTEEHLQILTYLGVSRAVVALTKTDLGGDEGALAAEVRERLRDTPFGGVPIVPTSVASGRGIDELKAALLDVLADAPPPPDIGKPRLPVDRVFTLRGIGTVVTGTLTGGALSRGQAVVIQPSGRRGRIRSLQSHSHDLEVSRPGMRTALSLPDLGPEDVRRGETVTLESFGGPGRIADVLVEVSPRAKRSLKDGARIRVHHGSCNVSAHVALSHLPLLSPGGKALGQLRLEAPTFLFAGDRFILRDWAEQNTLAGGLVLDPDPGRRSFRRPARLRVLEERARAPEEVSVFVSTQLSSNDGVPLLELLVKSRFSASAVSSTVSRLAEEGKVLLAGERVFDTGRSRALVGRAMGAVDAHHKAHPEQIGLALTDLRAHFKEEPSATVDAVLAELLKVGFVRTNSVIRRAAHRPALPPRLQVAGAKLRSALSAKPLDPPSRKELAPEATSQQALRFLVETGEAVEISADVVMSAEAFLLASESIRRFLKERGPATVSELRQALGSSRRVMVPLLERLDREGLTLRQDDRRTLRELRA